MKTLVIPKDEMTPIERSLAIKTSKPIWHDMAELGFSSVSLDNAMDLAEEQSSCRKKVSV